MNHLVRGAAVAAAALAMAAGAAALADSVKATVGHMCCGNCKSAAMAGVKAASWVEGASIEGAVMTVNAKAGQKVELVSLLEALNKAGFPATEVLAAGPITFNVAHMCCGNCASDLKTKIASFRSQVLDKDNVKVDQATKTVTVQPVPGRQLNLVTLLTQFQRAGFSASACMLPTVAASAR